MHWLLLAAAALSAADGTAPPAGLVVAPHALIGRVTNTSGQSVSDARVLVVELRHSVQTDPDGRYKIPDLNPGSYTVSFSQIGYAPVARRITVGDSDLTLDVSLKESLVELPPIQVTATPSATEPLTSPQPTAVVEGEDLKRAQASSLGETLNQVAGVHSLSTGVGIGKPVIRGLTSNRVLILDDGQRLETQQWGDEHGPNLETAGAERIEVIRGPASVLYGSDALGGVVNVIQPPLPVATEGHGPVEAQLSASYGSNNRQPNGALSIAGAKGGFGFRGTISGRQSEDLQTANYELWNSGNQAVGGSGTVGYHGSWGSVAGTISQRDEKIELTDEDPLATPLQRIATTRGRVNLTLPISGSRLELVGGYERNRRREFEDNLTSDVALGLLSQNYTLDARFYHAPLGSVHGILGVSGGHLVFDKFGEETLIPNNRTNNIGVYGFEQVTLGRWDLSVGLRYDYRHLDVDEDTVIAVTAQTRNWNAVTGNFGALYRLADPVALVLNVGRGFRAPSSFDLFSNGVHEGTVGFERGNPNLNTEKSLNTDLALRVQTANVALELGGFLNLIQDYIYSVPTGTTDPASGFQIYDVTQGDARLTGLEAAAQYHPTAWLHLQGTADYVYGTNTSTGNPLPAMPPFRATYSVRLESRRQGFLHVPYLSVGGESNAQQSRQDPAEAAFYSQAFGGQGYQSEAYTLINAGTGFGLAAGANDVHFDFTVRNVFDKAYADYLSRIKTNALNPGMGRSFVMQVSTAF
ncbi:MAG TPA: TonB-dependent receptor [Gemmatimonadales bacterium]|nr:TonB-dependent receptor [Gemmatimonadales bacterium]